MASFLVVASEAKDAVAHHRDIDFLLRMRACRPAFARRDGSPL